MPMRNLYSTKLITTSQDESHMNAPRKSTLNFLRNFARAYTFAPGAGTIICNWHRLTTNRPNKTILPESVYSTIHKNLPAYPLNTSQF